MKLSGYHVSIVSDGERLEEYSVEVSPDGKKTTCWISSQSGKVTYILARADEVQLTEALRRSLR